MEEVKQEENGRSEEKELKTSTVVFMISTAFFYDVLQFILGFIYMGWMVGIFAGLTFYVWFKLYGISFMKPKRFFAFTGASVIEMLPVPLLADLPAWTAAVSYLALTKKAQSIIPGVDITKLNLKL